MEIKYSDLKELIEESVENAMLRNRACDTCPLLEVGITHDEHKDHHMVLKHFWSDYSSVRKSVIAGILLTIVGGIGGLIWLGFKTKLFGGTP